ncbi:MAG: PASTA domain-containing protein [Treponema sp.]|nr:PASTA domain-containing protein [Treponema sp.]MCL2251237.1 PASTA domain-containing protein [Treponema sp.]
MGKFDLGSIEDYLANHLRLFIFSVAGLVIFVGIIAVSVFFIAVRGEEQTMVPDVVGKELTEALLELQVKELYPRLQLRYSRTSSDKGYILEQEPIPGSIVKASSRIRLTVSQGVILNRVENYISQSIDEVRMNIQTINASSGILPLFTIKEPLMYEFSAENPGIILAQKPEPDTDISGPTVLEFVVSKGRENLSINVPQLSGLSFTDALAVISTSGISYQFTVREKSGNERGGTIVGQTPSANNSVPTNTIVQLIVTPPDNIANNEVFGLFTYNIPQNPYPLSVRLEAQLPEGERKLLFTVNYMGGQFTVPYRQPKGTVLILSMLNRELYRDTIGD